MNTPNPAQSNPTAKPGAHLLDTIKALRASVGDGLNDDELTRLLRQTTLLWEAGFGFLSMSNGVVTFSVPHQDLARWRSEQGWMPPEKEKIARLIAKKNGLSLSEPPTAPSHYLFPSGETGSPHHHFEMHNRWEAVVVAHPHYLKVRLFGAAPGTRYAPDAKQPLLVAPDLLQDLSALYQT
jgi:hypothetical protein